jgi:ABC-type phosphate transport system substrate-binding protein
MRGYDLLIGILMAAVLAAPAFGEEMAVIVHVERDVELTRTELAQIYLKRRRFWGSGERILPINRDPESAARTAFVREIFGAEARRLEIYWNRQYFHGVLPPATLASDAAVLRFVASEKRAIGYVPAALVDTSVRIVLRIERPGAGGGAP